ncbi:hypothetical protein HW555_005253 [Spodoptera exigua]|uniref:Uncharacterized protein n=1 Tax=Spodoptera exigua TaxID=7107 RepID=A0A835GK37_SPOEX|nr:hypothetical protein HW555_005253 [Spodoptera exigua]
MYLPYAPLKPMLYSTLLSIAESLFNTYIEYYREIYREGHMTNPSIKLWTSTIIMCPEPTHQAFNPAFSTFIHGKKS